MGIHTTMQDPPKIFAAVSTLNNFLFNMFNIYLTEAVTQIINFITIFSSIQAVWFAAGTNFQHKSTWKNHILYQLLTSQCEDRHD